MKILFSLIGFLLLQDHLPNEFTYVDESSGIILEMRYCTSNNFIGRPIPGYESRKCILTNEAANALLQVQKNLEEKGYGLKVYDAYRPQMAVDYFVEWAKDLNDTVKKSVYYPNVKKSELFKEGYIASSSGHSRGSTVDVTLTDLNSGKELDMGTHYDYFSPLSHPFSEGITKEQQQNRMLLRKAMIGAGFDPLPTEWWHFTLKDEPFPETYFNFIVK